MTEQNGNGNTLAYRVKQLEDGQEVIEARLQKIMENHLPHIELAIVQLKTRMNVVTTINVSAIIIAIILQSVLA